MIFTMNDTDRVKMLARRSTRRMSFDMSENGLLTITSDDATDNVSMGLVLTPSEWREVRRMLNAQTRTPKQRGYTLEY